MRKKILIIVVSLVVLTLIFFLVIVVIDLVRQAQFVSSTKPPPSYTATRYIWLDGEVVSQPASSRVDIKLNGSDQPIKATAPASYTISWTLDANLLREGFRCSIDGMDEVGEFISKPIFGSGEWKIRGALITGHRSPNSTDHFMIICRKGEVPDELIELDMVDIWFPWQSGQ